MYDPVNNAGIQHVAPVHAYPDDTYDKLMAINLHAVFHASKAVLPGMIERRWGRIISTASVHGLVAYDAGYQAGTFYSCMSTLVGPGTRHRIAPVSTASSASPSLLLSRRPAPASPATPSVLALSKRLSSTPKYDPRIPLVD